jgi:predicted metal-dependent hydrolase
VTKRAVSDISYEVLRSKRATADIVIERDGRVLVRAPEAVADERIDALIDDKRYWIYKNLGPYP